MSESSKGPVDTGFRYSTPLVGDLFLNALHSKVDTTDLPTSVLAPYIWRILKSRHSIVVFVVWLVV